MERIRLFSTAAFLAAACLLPACLGNSSSDGDSVYCDDAGTCPADRECRDDGDSERRICVWVGPSNDCPDGGSCTNGDAGDPTGDAGDPSGDAGDPGDASDLGGRLDAPQDVTMPPVSVGDSVTTTITLQNVGQAALTITSLELREESGGTFDGELEFYRGQLGWDASPLTLAAGTSHNIEVRYSPTNTTRDAAELIIDSDDATTPQHTVSISTASLGPDIYSAQSISFGRVPPRPNEPSWQGDTRLTQVQNIGSARLDISDVYISGSDRFRVTFPQGSQPSDPATDSDQWPTTLASGDSFPVRVWFAPDDNLPETAELVFESNDPDASQYVVNLSGNSGAPCMQVSPSNDINFGQASPGQTAQKTITIDNCSRSSELQVSNIEISDDGGGVYAIQAGTLPGNLPASSATISAGERANFVVTFEPSAQTSYTGELTIVSDDSATSPLTIPILGRGSSNACPTAQATAWVQGSSTQQTSIQTDPLNTIQFDGSNSTDSDGSVTGYEWTILSRPQGSTQRLLPNSTEVNPRLFLDLAGTYEVELKAIDDQGAYSCGAPAVITIVATPNTDIHVQLVWDTPSDPDQSDSFGTDLDLHYLHPNGQWDSEPWDIFWRNPTADWGVTNDASDDPSLDLDDEDGAGPEEINHSDLENVQYRAGVYYYSDNTLGASYATLRVYWQGQLSIEIENQYMPRTGSFWDAVLIDGGSGNTTDISRMYQGFP
jgi:hypothetical protein